MSRAGLVSLVLFFLCITLAASAPLPEYSSSDVESFVARSDDYDRDLLTRSLDFDAPEIRELSFLRERDFDIGDGTYYKREFVTSDTAPLYRRSKVTQKINAAFHKAGAAIKHGFQKAGTAIKQGVQKAVKKVGTFVKNTGAKIAKFGLKVVSAAAGVLSTVSRFIPAVGPGLSAAFKGASAAADAGSNAIHANLGKKLNNGMKALNIIKDPIGAGISAAAKKAKHK
ncbi:uncharacterized protein LACBIDRAFT_293335 [Laccaria bicolor S238N-H82]|uniref:Predicted protein n=1 Tax=Laccaria bicolor (strain S238N-H82 / ATCC MYA-4686) TaxID=486041 RepID=B0D318_LACBS|nr:uncharacterized protein LACBIDRAFT_293335 [Laccaria bicolor S238N-H82]EDR11198.1 predicted protein [Laccaria bicolor S238N-H82]|eukprot:XP_001878499.1 predicted protein [Laccaria bicolor S238N-H82]